MRAVAGISEHRGWAIVVSVAMRERKPVVADRRRVELIDAGVPSQPYHHEGTELDAAQLEPLVRRVEQSVDERTRAELSRLRDELAPEFTLSAIALPERLSRPLPRSVAEVLESPPAMIEADGAIYRKALLDAAAGVGLDTVTHPRGGEIECAARALGVEEDKLDEQLTAMGRELGAPWRKEHRGAAAAAIAVLFGRRGSGSRKPGDWP